MAELIRSSRDFVDDVQDEMRKVTWPDVPQLKNSTFVIIVFVVIVAAVIFVMDYAVNGLLEVIRGVFGG